MPPPLNGPAIRLSIDAVINYNLPEPADLLLALDTLRGVARGLTLVTAHARGGEPLALDWRALARSAATLGTYMVRAAAAEATHGLIGAGMAPDMPVVVAVNVWLPTERLIRGRLSALPLLAKAVSDDDPTFLLTGEAVGSERFDTAIGPAGKTPETRGGNARLRISYPC